MSSLVRPLYELQQIDLAIVDHGAKLESLGVRLQGDRELDRLREQTSALEARLETAQRSLRSVERRVEELGETAERLNQRLYGGAIHDAREMASIEAEIAHADARRSKAEDEEIELMEQVETLEASLAQARSQTEERSQRREREVPELEADRARLAAELEELKIERSKRAAEIAPAQLGLYTRLQDRHGQAVARIEGGVCQVCRVQIPPADVQHARAERLVQCTNCSRILFVP